MGVKQGPPSVAVQLRDLAWDMHRRTQRLPTAAERIALIRDVVVFCVTFYTGKCGVKVSVAVASQLLQMAGGEGFIFNSLFGMTLRSSSQAVVVKEEPKLPRNWHGRSRGRVPTGGGIHAMVTGIEVRIPVSECYMMREYCISGVDAGTDDHQPLDQFAGGGHGGHEAVHRALFRVGRVPTHKMDRTVMGILMDYVG